MVLAFFYFGFFIVVNGLVGVEEGDVASRSGFYVGLDIGFVNVEEIF